MVVVADMLMVMVVMRALVAMSMIDDEADDDHKYDGDGNEHYD